MQLWFSRQSEISIRDQLATQIVLAIVSGELSPGQRLPSTRELARRFHLHPNTVSAGYRQLEQTRWVAFRKGSGVYVNPQKPDGASSQIALDQLIAAFFQSARRLNTPLAEIRARLRQWLDLQPPDHILLIEPDAKLADIVATEIQRAVSFPVHTCKPAACKNMTQGAIPVSLSISAKLVRASLPANSEILTLSLRSAGQSLARYLPASNRALIGIASGWAPFLKNARTMLIAAGFQPDCLVLRETTRAGWRRGLKETAAVVCDSLTAETLNGVSRVLTFPLLSESSLQELRQHEQFVRAPLTASCDG
jgi:GntR family transcriptional regulator